MQQIISLSGKKRHGKNTAANYLAAILYDNFEPTYFKSAVKNPEDLGGFLNNADAYHDAKSFMDTYGLEGLPRQFRVELKSFAHKVKVCASVILNLPLAYLDTDSFKNKFLPNWNMTGREFLQKLGTDAMRNGLHKDVWVKALLEDLKDNSNWIVTDTRFNNEISALCKLKSLNIYVFRPDYTKVKFKGTNEEFYLTNLSFETKKWQIKGCDVNNQGIIVWVNPEDLIFSKEDNHISEREMDFHSELTEIVYNTSLDEMFNSLKNIVEKHNLKYK